MDWRERRKQENKVRAGAEMRYGKFLVKRNMAQGVVDQLGSEIDACSEFVLVIADQNQHMSDWVVRVDFRRTGVIIEEPFSKFPSDELKAKFMLLIG